MSMNVSELMASGGISDIYNNYSTNGLKSITDNYSKVSAFSEENNDAFETVFQSALGLVEQTNEYSNIAEEEELNYAMGLSEDTHTLMIAQQKANISLQYTVAVRDAVIDAYNEIMNMQF